MDQLFGLLVFSLGGLAGATTSLTSSRAGFLCASHLLHPCPGHFSDFAYFQRPDLIAVYVYVFEFYCLSYERAEQFKLNVQVFQGGFL